MWLSAGFRVPLLDLLAHYLCQEGSYLSCVSWFIFLSAEIFKTIRADHGGGAPKLSQKMIHSFKHCCKSCPGSLCICH